MTTIPTNLDACLVLLAAWVVIGCAGLASPRNVGFVARVLFPLGGAVGLALALVAGRALAAPAAAGVLPLGMPGLPFHVRLDALSCLFLVLLGAVAAGISIFAAGYLRHDEVAKGAVPPPDAHQRTAAGLLCLHFHLFLASMGFVLLADDAYAFMVAWESMALTSYFLVTTEHRNPATRRAGFLYLLIAHLGAIAILLSFATLQGASGQFTFASMRTAQLAPAGATTAFLMALVGFGAKAGLVPLHVWLPEAHPAAPSPVSALMSAVMLKTAVYGMLRVTFDLLGHPQWWWGLVALVAGLFSAFYGVIFAAVQTDMKRLLAWSSIENIGLIFAGFGLSIVFAGLGMRALAALALVAALYHCLNHAFMKSLLFLGTGAVLYATGERNLGRLGGLIRRMPWVAWLTLVGALAIAGLPPLNGFVSEWLLLQAFLFAGTVPRLFVDMLLPIGAAIVALCAALSGYVMVKFFGVIFLGQPREPALREAADAGLLERAGLLWLAAGCFALGLLPVQVIGRLEIVSQLLIGADLGASGAPWWLLRPSPARQASYGALVLLGGIVAVVLATFLIVRAFYQRQERRSAAWDCGFGRIDARMQDTAEGFGQPIRHVFEPFFLMQRTLPSPDDLAPRYEVTVTDRIWRTGYEPIGRLVRGVADLIARLQQGRISTYLLYSFVTLIVLLAVVL
jgi:formate hydrogenlyase subunit 3/multisubunit Na+/H+ antiporter MnhD subunit